MICCLNPDCPNPLNSDGTKICETCGTPLVKFLRNRFRVIRVLSDEGGFGRTYLAEDVDKLKELCVIKQLAPKLPGSWALKKAMELFQKEATRLQQLGEHSQIPTLLAYFEQDNYLYLVQQFIDGQNLSKELQFRRRGIGKQARLYAESEIKQILLDLLPVLKYIHQRGVVHRDIKPQNIIRRKKDRRLALIDFGSSKQLTARVQIKAGTSIGSHGYCPIEQIRDGVAFPASDLFSLGATCFHLLTGTSPFKLWTENGYNWVNDWRQYLSHPIDEQLALVMEKLLKKDIKQRYQSAEQAFNDLSSKPLDSPANESYEAPIFSPSGSNKYLKPQYLFFPLTAIAILGLGQFWYLQAQKFTTEFSSSVAVDNQTSKINQNKQRSQKFSLANTISGGLNSILSVAIGPDSRIVASNSNQTIKLWDTQTGREITTLKGHKSRVNAIVINPVRVSTPQGFGKIIASSSEDKTIKIWNLETGSKIRTITGHSDSVHALAISPDGKILASGSNDKTVRLWNLETGKEIRTITGHSSWVRSVAISQFSIGSENDNDINILASGSTDKTIKVWNLSTGKLIHTLKGHTQSVTSLAMSPGVKGRSPVLISGSADRSIKIWDLSTGELVRNLEGHTQSITSLAINPANKLSNNKTFASGSTDRTIKIWNISTGELISTLSNDGEAVSSLAYSWDGETIVSGSEDKTIKIWRLSH
ncbi:serine/threonine-protein kinase [Mastigocoleus testarum]|uniref:Serine/threonine protein kinase n=1 Tax=Mastigocoleus testarum BC008 TaxID=371196 RepID=A0A0V7ZKR1_9CYAN|nr:serine/threonine-protein kinase [Mastigocoleus testarum]KST64929.1 serine/threonine protein kinase [Mastigocoleus testarum BC008]KST65022.1 serine/threonine protein kinase [Mastigocoleus testarum BC008]